MTLTESLIALSTAYGQARMLSRARLSTLLFNDGKSLDRIAAGGDLNTRSYEKALRWFADNWPADAAWPEGVARPAASEQVA